MKPQKHFTFHEVEISEIELSLKKKKLLHNHLHPVDFQQRNTKISFQNL